MKGLFIAYTHFLALSMHTWINARSLAHTHIYIYINRTVVFIFSCFPHSLCIINQHYMVCVSSEIKINTFKIGFISYRSSWSKESFVNEGILVNFILHAVAQCANTKARISLKLRTQEEILLCIFFIKRIWSASFLKHVCFNLAQRAISLLLRSLWFQSSTAILFRSPVWQNMLCL